MDTPVKGEWRDGFPFIGNELSLDFLNTRPVMDSSAGPEELFKDPGSLARWMAAAELTPAQEAKRLAREWEADPASMKMLDELLLFREQLRAAVLQLEGGRAPSKAFIQTVNDLLVEHPCLDQVRRVDAEFVRGKRFAPQTPFDLLAPVADSVARLLTGLDHSRLRKCGACVLHFYDRSKKGTRRWCSMNMCGNRSKVAAYASRKRREV